MIRVGPAGWSYADWRGIVYPRDAGRKFDELEYLCRYFDTVEINSPFYRIPPRAHAESWARRTNANQRFVFTTKIYRGFTHEKGEPGASEVEAFRNFLDVLAGRGKLGALLLQFPWSFKDSEESRSRLSRLFEQFAAYPKVVEVRHGSFARKDFYDFAAEHDSGVANIDQPLLSGGLEPAGVAIGAAAYVRFHGRNTEKWFQHEEAWERYDYLYSGAELEPWITRIRAMATKKDVFVITNNHFRGQAVVNALELKRGLGQPAEAPPSLAAAYPGRL